MSDRTLEDQLLPRPVSVLPDYASARARRAAADKLMERFGLGEEAATCIADAVVDPAELRVAMEHCARLAVPGGTVLALRAEIWSRKTQPDPRNPRIGPVRRHPFAVDPGTDEESRFRPVPEPTSNGSHPWLGVEIESREHLTWASEQARKHILETNDWRYSIRAQGVLTEVWLVATKYRHTDGSPDLWAMTTAEGSSRVTAVHDILGQRAVDAAYDVGDRQMRANIVRLNEARERGATVADLEALRCERMPGLILVGFESHPGGDERFSTAVRSLVALRHVDAPKEWGEGPEMESLADAVLEEMEREGLLTPVRRRWLAAATTRMEAEAAHLSSDPAVRAAAVVEVFTSSDARYRDAMRRAVTSQSTRRRISPLLRTKLATALIVRALGGAGENVDRVRRYMQHAFSEAVRDGDWSATSRHADELLAEALIEVEQDPDAFGTARLELAARAAYPLIASLRLWADRGSSNNNQPDRRTPGQVIDAMLREPRGVRQLHRALFDYANHHPIRVVDAAGQVVLTDDGAQERHVSDLHLRSSFPPPGDIKPARSSDTAGERLQTALARLAGAVRQLETAQREVEAVLGFDGTALVETEGVAVAHCDAWQNVLDDAAEAIVLWRATWKRRHRYSGSVPAGYDDVIDESEDVISEWEQEGALTELAEQHSA